MRQDRKPRRQYQPLRAARAALPRKTAADAEMLALGAEPAAFPLKNALRKTLGKPVILGNRHLFCSTRTINAQFSICADIQSGNAGRDTMSEDAT